VKKLFNVKIGPLAEADLGAISRYIRRQSNTETAIRFVDGLEAKCQTLSRTASSFRLRFEYGENVRAIRHKKYLILFEVINSDVTVLRILHPAQDLENLFKGKAT
jgi:toxin ParE1/3/4